MIPRLAHALVLCCATACANASDGGEVHEPPYDDPYWPAAYQPSCAPTPASGYHEPGSPCLTCHAPGAVASPFLVAGTVVDDAGAGAPQVELGFRRGSAVAVVCSGENGNFWLPGTDIESWLGAAIRLRRGPREHPSAHSITTVTRECNLCHVVHPP